jgi:hypothetical protein
LLDHSVYSEDERFKKRIFFTRRHENAKVQKIQLLKLKNWFSLRLRGFA